MAAPTAPAPRRIVVLISGSGTNLQALIDAQSTPALPRARIVLVLSNRKAAHGLVRAASATPPIPTACLALQPFLKAHPGATRAAYDAAVARIVRAADPDIVVLAGWMHVMGDAFLTAMDGTAAALSISGSGDGDGDGDADAPLPPPARPIPVINLHPALPGAFDGVHAIERAYAAFQRGEIAHSGVMVHRVVKEVDRGVPVLVREVAIVPGEPVEAFEERLHAVEWEVIVQATAKVLDEVESA